MEPAVMGHSSVSSGTKQPQANPLESTRNVLEQTPFTLSMPGSEWSPLVRRAGCNIRPPGAIRGDVAQCSGSAGTQGLTACAAENQAPGEESRRAPGHALGASISSGSARGGTS